MNKKSKSYNQHLTNVISSTIPLGTTEIKTREENYLPMLNGPATNTLAITSSKKMTADPITGKAVMINGDMKIIIENFNDLKGGLTIGALKLLDFGTIELTKQNHYKEKNSYSINCTVIFSLKEYAIMCGYDVIEKDTNTAEEKIIEKKRVKYNMDNFRKKVNQDLKTLYEISIEGIENSKKNSKEVPEMRIISFKNIKNGNVIMSFSEPMAYYLINSYVMQYPVNILKLNERYSYSYNIARKLALHSSMDNNIKKGTDDIISVKSLLDCTGLPKWKDVNGHWTRRIKEPFEKALDEIKTVNAIKYWEYSNSKKEVLTDNQKYISNYEIFEKIYIHFKMESH